jgi:hypothetical protein
MLLNPLFANRDWKFLRFWSNQLPGTGIVSHRSGKPAWTFCFFFVGGLALPHIARPFSSFSRELRASSYARGQMSVDHKGGKGNVTFALAIVKASVVSNRAESSRVRAALQTMFPGISVILVAEDNELSSYQKRRELSEFAEDTPFKVIASSKVTSN